MPDDTTEAREFYAREMERDGMERDAMLWRNPDRPQPHGSRNRIIRAMIAYAYAARLAAIEECAKACEEQREAFFSPEYATGQPMSSRLERFACGQCADAIRQLGSDRGDEK